MENKSVGIDEMLDVVKFVKDLAAVIKDAKSDGKLDIFDAIKLMTIVPSIVSAVRGADEIRDEFGDLNGAERDILLHEFKEAMFALIGALK